MSLLKTWRDAAYENENEAEIKELWRKYFEIEKGYYSKVLSNTEDIPTGNINDISEKYGVGEVFYMTGIIDGMNESLKTNVDMEELTEETELKLELDLEKLFMNMVAAKADWLYELPEWDGIFSLEKRKELFKTQKLSGTIVKDKEPGRNEPCPCGSGKKYKKCCGKN